MNRCRTVLAAALLCTFATFATADSDGSHLVEAIRFEVAPRIDGVLDDSVWESLAAASSFTQLQPNAGTAAGQPTNVWVGWDQDNLYVGFRCTEAPDQMVARALGRDASLDGDDSFQIVLDTYGDRQHGYVFLTNPNGVRRDGQFRDEGDLLNFEWDGIWQCATRQLEDGWEGEIAIPWTSLRFPSGGSPEMGINFARRRRAQNELSSWAPIERQYNIYRVSSAGTLRGMSGLRSGRDLLLRPYVLGRVEKGNLLGGEGAWREDEWEFGREVGLDLRLGLGSNLSLDLSVNTDFAQVEVDDQLVNLTRFPLFLPEKREFFLEKRDFFSFGSPANRPFFSRRLGLSPNGQPIQIHYGARLTGKVGRTGIGLMDVDQASHGDQPAKHFDVLRLSHDIGSRSRVGLLGVFQGARDVGDSGVPERHQIAGLDAELRPSDALQIALYGAVVDMEEQGEDHHTWGTRWRYSHPWGAMTWIHESVGENYSAPAGFVPRRDVDLDIFSMSHTPEINRGGVRTLDSHVSMSFASNRHGPFESRSLHVHPVAVGHGGGNFGVFFNDDFEFLSENFPFALGRLEFTPGNYRFQLWGTNLSTDPSRILSGNLVLSQGEFYNADRRSAEFGLALRPSPRWSLGADVVDNLMERGAARATNTIVRLRGRWAANNAFSVDAFIQRDNRSETLISQLRMHYLFGDRSDFYLVLTDGHGWDSNGLGRPWRQEFTLKVNYAIQM